MIFVTAVWTLRRDRLPLLYFLLAAIGVWSFLYLKYYGSLRHHGHLYLAWLATMWLAAAAGPRSGPMRFARRAILCVQAVAGIWLAAADWTTPFSANQRAAEWIAAGDFREFLLAGSEPHAASGVGMHLRRPIYYLNSERWGTYFIHHKQSRQFATPDDLFQAAAQLGEECGRPVLLILNREIPEQDGFQQRASFREALIADERFFIYTYELSRPAWAVSRDEPNSAAGAAAKIGVEPQAAQPAAVR
jgi:hypothetical protein